MTTQQIISSNQTKTAKAQALFDLGLSRRQVADLVLSGNYGFAQNIYKKWSENRNAGNTAAIEPVGIPFGFYFNRTFGVEIEFYGTTHANLKRELKKQGIAAQTESYNHNTRNHWKITSDSSVTGAQTGELVSPILKGAAGLEKLKKVCLALKKAGAAGEEKMICIRGKCNPRRASPQNFPNPKNFSAIKIKT